MPACAEPVYSRVQLVRFSGQTRLALFRRLEPGDGAGEGSGSDGGGGTGVVECREGGGGDGGTAMWLFQALITNVIMCENFLDSSLTHQKV